MPENVKSTPTIFTKFLASELEVNQDERTIGFSFSSKNNVVERYLWNADDLPEGASRVFDEAISHDPTAWDLSRVNSKTCPFLKNHVRGQKYGVIRQVELDGEKGMAIAKLSKNQLADQYLSDVLDGTDGGISFGYTVQEYKVITPAEYKVSDDGYMELTKKALLEASKVTLYEISTEDIPADPTVGYGKSFVDLDSIQVKGDPNFLPQISPMSPINTNSELTSLQTKHEILLTEHSKQVIEIKQLSEAIQSKESENLELKTEILELKNYSAIASRYYELRQKAFS
jgi:hypothetical protein